MPESGGLVTSFLGAFSGLMDMERQKKRDQQQAAQFAVDTELRKHEMKLREETNRRQAEAQQLMEAHRLELERQGRERETTAKERENRLAQQGQELDLHRQVTEEQTAKTEEDRVKAQSRTAFLNSFKGLWERSALGPADKPITGRQAMQFASAMSGYEPDPNMVSALEGQYGKGFLDQPNQALVTGIELKRAQAKQLNELMETNKELKDAQVKKVTADAMVSEARYKDLMQKISTNKEKWEFEKWFKKGELDIRQRDLQFREWAERRKDDRERLAVSREARSSEQMFRLYKNDAQRIYDETRKEYEKAKDAHDKAATLKANVILKKMEGQPLDAYSESLLWQADATLAEHSPQRIKELEAAMRTAEHNRNEADRTLKGVQGFWTTSMTDKGVPSPRQPKPGSLAPAKVGGSDGLKIVPRSGTGKHVSLEDFLKGK